MWSKSENGQSFEEGIVTKLPWRRRGTWIALAAVMLLTGVSALVAAWYFADQMILPVHRAGRESYRERVDSVRMGGDGRMIVSLRRTRATRRQGIYSLFWEGGSAQIGPIIAQDAHRVDREVVKGPSPLGGAHVGMSWSYGADPKDSAGLNFSEMIVNTERGPAPAWYIPADSDGTSVVPANTWVITVHGSNADRRQFLRFIPELHNCGLSVLDITYRNDVGAPKSADNLMHLGLTEWRDLDQAVGAAEGMGAKHIILFGGSMGGAIVLQYLTKSAHADRIAGVLLEAPMLSVPAMTDYIGKEHRMPGLLTDLATWVIDARLNEDVSKIDVLRFPPKAHPQTLLLQGLDDEIMPHELAREVAIKGREIGWAIRYVEFPGADHGGVWNSDPVRVEAQIRTFLQEMNWQRSGLADPSVLPSPTT